MPKYCMPHVDISGGDSGGNAQGHGRRRGKAHGKSRGNHTRKSSMENRRGKGSAPYPLLALSPSFHPTIPYPLYPLSLSRKGSKMDSLRSPYRSLPFTIVLAHARACPLFHWRYIMSMHLALRESTGRREKPEDKSEEGMTKACRHESTKQSPRFPLGRSARAHARSEAPIAHAYVLSPEGDGRGNHPPASVLMGRRPRGGFGGGAAACGNAPRNA